MHQDSAKLPIVSNTPFCVPGANQRGNTCLLPSPRSGLFNLTYTPATPAVDWQSWYYPPLSLGKQTAALTLNGNTLCSPLSMLNNMAAAPENTLAATNGIDGEANVPATNGTSETTTTTTAPGLSADEIALYDRQIRLWGAQAQERIRSANVLLVSLRALGTEIAKNLTLAGISSLTIVDDEPVTEDDLGAGYFLREEDIGKPVCYALTPFTFDPC